VSSCGGAGVDECAGVVASDDDVSDPPEDPFVDGAEPTGGDRFVARSDPGSVAEGSH
jgi:hypothetical protein